jgi:hypothetical protein
MLAATDSLQDYTIFIGLHLRGMFLQVTATSKDFMPEKQQLLKDSIVAVHDRIFVLFTNPEIDIIWTHSCLVLMNHIDGGSCDQSISWQIITSFSFIKS